MSLWRYFTEISLFNIYDPVVINLVYTRDVLVIRETPRHPRRICTTTPHCWPTTVPVRRPGLAIISC